MSECSTSCRDWLGPAPRWLPQHWLNRVEADPATHPASRAYNRAAGVTFREMKKLPIRHLRDALFVDENTLRLNCWRCGKEMLVGLEDCRTNA